MVVHFNRWPQGRVKCLTLSYDDGVIEDRQLIGIMNEHGLRGSFHLNSGILNDERHVSLDELRTTYAGHEISVHMVNHTFPTRLPREGLLMEILEDRRALEKAAGYPVRGMSYPWGDYDQRTIPLFETCGIEYARTVRSHSGFHLPERWLEWHPTCHHNQCVPLADTFIAQEDTWGKGLLLFYVWGHSYEFPRANNWNLIEEFARKIGRRDDIWYATNIEIVDYVNATRAVRTSVDGTMLHNPTATPVWFTVWRESEPRVLSPGETLILG